MTSNPSTDTAITSLRMQVTDYVIKPVSQKDVLSAVRRALCDNGNHIALSADENDGIALSAREMDVLLHLFQGYPFSEMATLFPDEYFHIGGDENNGNQWDGNESIQEFMEENGIENNHELQVYFNKRVLEILTKQNKKMIGWDEILVPGIPKSVLIQSWQGQESLVESAREGYKGILSNGYYIDLMQPASDHYLNDPIPVDSPLSNEEKRNILGGETTMWSEFVTEETVDSRIWPRTAAIAERFWSSQSINDIDDMYERMNRISYLFKTLP